MSDDGGIPASYKERPLPSRIRFTRAFLDDVAVIWHRFGFKALEQIAQTDPMGFVRVAASLIPKEVRLDMINTPMAQMSAVELQAIVVADATTAEKMKKRLVPLIDRLAEKDEILAEEMHAALEADDEA
jgi:hypothetical protein